MKHLKRLALGAIMLGTLAGCDITADDVNAMGDAFRIGEQIGCLSSGNGNCDYYYQSQGKKKFSQLGNLAGRQANRAPARKPLTLRD